MYFGLDIDECAVPTTCAGERQSCVNTPGSFRCSCEKHYTLSDGQCIKKEKGKLSFIKSTNYNLRCPFPYLESAYRVFNLHVPSILV